MEIKDEKVLFSTGKTRNANRGIIGLAPDMTLTEGYDDGFWRPKEDWEDDEDDDALSKTELIELADYMIALWQRFKAERCLDDCIERREP